MKKAIIFVISGLILIVAFSLMIYPTKYTYREMISYYDGNGIEYRMEVRINNFTGEVRFFDEGGVWRKWEVSGSKVEK